MHLSPTPPTPSVGRDINETLLQWALFFFGPIKGFNQWSWQLELPREMPYICSR